MPWQFGVNLVAINSQDDTKEANLWQIRFELAGKSGNEKG